MGHKDNLLSNLPPSLASEFLDTMPICFSYWNSNLDTLYCNKAYITLFDLKSQDEYIRRHRELSPTYQPDGQLSSTLGYSYINKAFEEGRCSFNWTHQKFDGELIPSEVTLVRVIHNGERFLSCYLRDLREAVAHEKAVQRSNKQKQFILDTMPLVTEIWSKEHKLIDCSMEVTRMFGLNNEQEFFDNFEKLIPTHQPNGVRSLDVIDQMLTEAFTNGHARLEWMYQTLQGEEIPCDVTLIRSDIGDEPNVFAYTFDLRGHYEHIAKLHAMENRTRILLDANPFGTLIWDKDCNLVDSNQSIATMFSLDSAQDFIDNFFSLIPELQPDQTNSLKKMYSVLSEALTHGTAKTYWVGQSLDKTPIPTEVNLVRVLHNNEYMIVGYIKDLREIESSRKKIQAVEKFTSAILSSVPLGISIWNKNFERIDCNESIVHLFKYDSKEEFLSSSFKCVPEFQPDGSNSMEFLRKQFTTAWQDNSKVIFEVMMRDKNMNPLPLQIKFIRTQANGEDILISYSRDLSDIKASIKAIQDAEERVQTVLNKAPLCINLFDEQGNLVDCNQAGWSLFGFDNKQGFIDGMHLLFPEFQPDGRRSEVMVQDSLMRALQEGHFRIQTVANTISGEVIPCDVILESAVINGKDMVISFVQDLREINAALEQAHNATKAAEKSARAKSDFLANMSHEIRTPMNGILGLLHILSHTELNGTQKDYVAKSLLSANNLLRIINDILDFSKIDAGKLEIERIPFTIHEICDELQSLFMPKVKEKSLACCMHEGCFSTTTILGDPVRLKQVLLNLIGNAIKFTHQGEVSFHVEANVVDDKELHCTFSVRDTGIGLNQEQLDKLFSAFTQADASVTRQYGGTGLGLIISKRIVEMMRGKIWAESVIGQGSTFNFTAIFDLPCSDEVDNTIHTLEVPSKEQIRRNAHLLLVEDNEINQIIAEELLKSVGYTLDIANNGQEALALLDKKHYDLVLMDIQMPIMDGLTAASKIRENKKYASLPIIAMSAHAMIGHRETSLKHGMNEHITKPIAPATLYSTLDYWLNRK